MRGASCPTYCLAVFAALATLGATGCARRTTLNDALRLYQAGRYPAVVAACEEELARWEAVDGAVTAALPAALASVEAMVADDALLVEEPIAGPPRAGDSDDEHPDFGATDPPLAAADARAALREQGIDAGGGGGAALRALADDLFSDSPLRIVRATEQVTELALERLAPHLVANVFSPRALDGDAGTLDAHPVAVRMLAVKTWETRAVRTLLLGLAPERPTDGGR